MDWAAILSKGVIDPDPASDVEREEGSNVRAVVEDVKKGKGKSKSKSKAVIVSKHVSDDEGYTVSSIIEHKPPKKIVFQFLKHRIEEILDEMEND